MSKQLKVKESVAELLMGVARMASGNRITICEVGDSDMDVGLAIVRLALILKKRPDLQFKALVEDLDMPGIIREVW